MEGKIVTLGDLEKYVAFLEENPREMFELFLDDKSGRLKYRNVFLSQGEHAFRGEPKLFILSKNCFRKGHNDVVDTVIKANASRRPKVNAYLRGEELNFDKMTRMINGQPLFEIPGFLAFTVNYLYVGEEFLKGLNSD